MRVVLDTNFFISALISSHGAPDTIYNAWRASQFDLITSLAQLDELRRVSRYPKLKAILPSHHIGAIINNVQRAIVLEHLPNLPQSIEMHDPDDSLAVYNGFSWSSELSRNWRPTRGIATSGQRWSSTYFDPNNLLR